MGLFKIHVNLFAQITVISAFEDLQKSLAAGIHNACLFQNREHIRWSGKYVLRMSDHIRKETAKIPAVLCDLQRLVRCSLGHCQDRSFFWLHNSFIGSLHTFLKRFCKGRCIHGVVMLNGLCKTSQKLRKDNT